MFVRAVWRQKRLVKVKRALREVDGLLRTNVGIIGVLQPDFSNMTRGLFDRQI